ncbi:MAG: hypothetical protein AAFN81_23565 [Bacteroidota bacterium]
MKTITILAIGIYLGRQLYVQFDAEQHTIREQQLQRRLQRQLLEMGYSEAQTQRTLQRIFKPSSHADY